MSASITILLLCLQLKQFWLGATLVLCFSIRLPTAMVTVGAAVALSIRHVENAGQASARSPAARPFSVAH